MFKNIGSKLNHELLFSFLKRCFLFQFFVIDYPNTNTTFDFAGELSFQSLCKRYNFTLTQIVSLSPFLLIDLPSSFLDFGRPPLSFPLENQKYERMICLLNGVFVKASLNDPIDYPLYSEYIKVIFSRYQCPIPFLILSNRNISAVFLANPSNRMLFQSIYVDQFGLSNVGFQRMSNLTLSQKNLQALIDYVLSVGLN